MKSTSAGKILAGIDNWPERVRLAQYRAGQLARVCRTTRRALERFLREHFGLSPQKFIDGVRAVEARKLIEAGQTLKEVASALGFRQISHLSRKFKLHFGITVLDCKRRARKTDLILLVSRSSRGAPCL